MQTKIYIIRPTIIYKVKYKEYNLTINNSYIRGNHYKLLKNKDKSNTPTLSFKF